MDNNHYDLSDYPTDQQNTGGRVEPIIMSRRDYFAATALQGLLANSFNDGFNKPLSMANQEEMAVMARDQANHLIKALAK